MLQTVHDHIRRARLLTLAYILITAALSIGALLIAPSAFTLVGGVSAALMGIPGLIYWTHIVRHGWTASAYRVVLALYALATLIVLAYPTLLTLTFIAPPRTALPASGIVIGGVLYIVACASYVHLFLVKLVRSADDQRARTTRRQVTARLMRELARGAARQGRS